MPLNLKNPNAIVNHEVSPALDSLVKDWGPTLNRWALKIENRLDVTHKKAVEARLFIPAPAAPATTTGTDVDDGLIHGDAVWEVDPAFIILRDDFVHTNVASSTSGNIISEMAWSHASTGVAAGQHNTAFPNLGNLVFTNSATVNQGNWLMPQPVEAGSVGLSSNFWPVWDYPAWEMVWIFKVGRPYQLFTHASGTTPPVAFSFSKVSCYVGLGCTPINQSGTTLRPSHFVGVRFDTDTTAPAISDTHFVFEAVTNNAGLTNGTRINTQGNTSDTGMTPTEGATYRLSITCSIAGQAKLTLSNGSSTATATLNVPNFTATPNAGLGAVTASNGIACVQAISGASSAACPLGGGSKFTISGTSTAYDGNQIFIGSAGNNDLNFITSTTGSTTNAVVTGEPAMGPYIAFGNSSEAAPTASSKALILDFFGFVWNPGVGGGTGTPTTNKARYW